MFDASMKIESKYFKSFMREMKVKVSNLTPVWKQYEKYIRSEINQQFSSEVDPEGKPWAPLKPATLKKKKTPYKLRESFRMFNSLVFRMDKDSLEWYFTDDKYKYHHSGSSTMPARVVIGDTQKRRGVLNKMIVGHLRTKRAGRSRK